MPASHTVEHIEGLKIDDLRALLKSFRLIRFAPEVEADFRYRYHRYTISVIRYALILALTLVVLLTALDWLLLPREFAAGATLLRGGIMLPAIAAIFGLTWVRGLQPHFPALSLCFASIVGVATMAVGALAQIHGVGNLFAGLIVVTIYVYMFLGLRLSWALWAGLPLAVMYVGIALAFDAPFASLVYNSAFLFFANLLGAAGCYMLELSFRRVYLESRLLHHLVGRDGLTRLYNRAMFDDHYPRVWRQAVRENKSVAVILMDIDYFKRFNDEYGHHTGDQCLRLVADNLLLSARRPLDFVARYGGEEFVAVLYDATADYVDKLCARIHSAVAMLNIPHTESKAAERVTVSLGVGILRPGEDTSAEQGITMADEALYEAKDAGRNCSVVHKTQAFLAHSQHVRKSVLPQPATA